MDASRRIPFESRSRLWSDLSNLMLSIFFEDHKVLPWSHKILLLKHFALGRRLVFEFFVSRGILRWKKNWKLYWVLPKYQKKRYWDLEIFKGERKIVFSSISNTKKRLRPKDQSDWKSLLQGDLSSKNWDSDDSLISIPKYFSKKKVKFCRFRGGRLRFWGKIESIFKNPNLQILNFRFFEICSQIYPYKKL